MADLITFKCSQCQHVLKVGGDKAGRKAKCPKCALELVVPGGAAAAPEPPKVEEEDEGRSYGFAEEKPSDPSAKVNLSIPVKPAGKRRRDDDEDDAPRPGSKKGESEAPKALPRAKSAKNRTLLEPERWQPVKLALVIMAIGLGFWAAVSLIHKIPILLGGVVISQDDTYATQRFIWSWIWTEKPDPPAPPQYAEMARRYTQSLDAHAKEAHTPGSVERLGPNYLGRAAFAVGILSGEGTHELALWTFRIVQVLLFLQGLILVAGYFICLPIPERFGTKGLVISLLVVGGLNLIFLFFFKLLPLTGAVDYTMLMLVAPEIPMVSANAERPVPLQEYWSYAPFWEILLALIISLLGVTEPVLIAALCRAIAKQMKNDDLEKTTRAMLQLAVAQGFFVTAYFLVSGAGTSDVLIAVIRVLYVLGYCFFLGQMIWFVRVLLSIPPKIDKELAVD